MILLGGLGAWFWGSWVAAPFFLCYGVLYGSASDSRWHEAGHGTAFRTRWMNDVVYQIASFMIMREPTVWRWSHARHHTDTLIVGRDPEIVAMRPPRLAKILANSSAWSTCRSPSIACSCTPAAGSRPTRRPSSPRWSGPKCS
jgi:fatty acid desaturase